MCATTISVTFHPMFSVDSLLSSQCKHHNEEAYTSLKCDISSCRHVEWNHLTTIGNGSFVNMPRLETVYDIKIVASFPGLSPDFYGMQYEHVITPRAHARSGVKQWVLSVSVSVCQSSKFGADHDNEGSKRF